jgi:hypothetical protein
VITADAGSRQELESLYRERFAPRVRVLSPPAG